MSRREHRDPSKERFWRRMARQWRKSGLTARDFARQQGLSEHSFYGWLRTLRLRDQQAVAFLPVRVAADQPDQAAPTTAARMTRRGLARAASCPPVPATVARMTRRATTATPPAADGTGAVDAAIGSVELLLPGGQRLCIAPGFDAATLQRLLAVLAEGPSC